MPELAIDTARLRAFEDSFDPAHPAGSRITVLGHGKFSTVFTIEGMEDLALKRLPPFPSHEERALHERALNAYHMLLQKSVGLHVVPQRCVGVTNGDGEHLLYVVQARQPGDRIGDRVLAGCDDAEAAALFEALLRNVLRVWHRNEIEKELDVPDSVTGLDAELSNWAVTLAGGEVVDVVYLDTTTPLFRRLGQDRLDPELFLGSVPAPLAGLVRNGFVEDILQRYYDLRLVVLDFLADLFQIGQEARLPMALGIVNRFLETEAADLYVDPIAREEVERYARRDARFWKRYLALSRFQRFLKTKALGQKYNFVLPE